MILRSRAPLRISFAGGGTDVSPFPETEGGAVLSATLNRYAYGSLRPRGDGRIRIESVDLDLQLDFAVDEPVSVDGELALVKAAIRRLCPTDTTGFDLVLRSSAPPGSGLGSSSTLMVALVALMQDYCRLPLSEYEVAELAYEIEREDLGIAGGMQDQYAAAFGGCNFIEFQNQRVIVNPLRVKQETLNELELGLLLCYTGKTRNSTNIIADQTARTTKGEEDTLSGLRAQKELAVAMKTAVLRGEMREFGELLNQAWLEKKKLSPLITTPALDEAFEVARANGAIGGKVTGAGGGGHMLFFCEFESKHKVADALSRIGCSWQEVTFSTQGVTTWRT
jgi:D-glycero-alpha-D-manno-heptose-7-phosphate kinase